MSGYLVHDPRLEREIPNFGDEPEPHLLRQGIEEERALAGIANELEKRAGMSGQEALRWLLEQFAKRH